MISGDKLERIMRLADQAAAAEPNSRGVTSLDDVDYGETPEARRLLAFVTGLSSDEKSHLVAIIWIGRGETWKKAEHYDEALRSAKSSIDGGTDEYIVALGGKLSTYIRKGMSVLGRMV